MVLYWPLTGPGGGVPHLDKLAHALVFAAVAFTGRRAGVPLLPLGALLVAHAVASEIVQATLLPGRHGDPWDAVADLVGTAIGLVAGLPQKVAAGRSRGR